MNWKNYFNKLKGIEQTEETMTKSQSSSSDLAIYKELLSITNDSVSKSLNSLHYSGNKEKTFAVEVLNKSLKEVNGPKFRLKPYEKHDYYQWLTKSMSDKTSGLKDWIKKK